MMNYSVLKLSKTVLLNLNRNWLGYLIFTGTLYLLTPFSLELNDWPVIRHRLVTLLELPVKAIDSVIAAVEDK